MNTKTLISTLALTLALGSLALPGTASARDYERDGDRQEHSRDQRDRDSNRHHRRDQRRDRYEHYRHDNGNHYGRIRWIPYVPHYRPAHRDHGYYTTYGGGYYGGYADPNTIIRIETRW